jgi:Flp pilus assembly protein TadG
MRRPTLLTACGGTAAIEMAFLLPTFMLMFFGIVEFGRMLWMQSTLQQAVEAAARCTVVNTTTCDNAADTQSYAASQVSGFTVASSRFTVSTPSCGGQVSVSLPFNFVAPNLLPWIITLSAQSCYPT